MADSSWHGVNDGGTISAANVRFMPRHASPLNTPIRSLWDIDGVFGRAIVDS
jgi:hypothetical protein